MIKPRVAKSERTKLLILFDGPQSKQWGIEQRCGKYGMEKLLMGMNDLGFDLDSVAVQCLSDSDDGKAAGFTTKRANVDEYIGSVAPNVILLANSKAFEKYTGLKGASKFYNKVFQVEGSDTKLITIPPYSILAYNPSMADVIVNTLYLVKKEMEFREFNAPVQVEKNYILVNTIELFREWQEVYKGVTRYALDLETNSLQFNNGKILTIQFSEEYNKGWCIPTNDFGGNWSDAEWAEIIAGVKEVAEDDSKERILANAYFDLKFLSYVYGFKLPKENVTDILIQAFLVDENRESQSLKFCAATLLEGAGDYERPLTEFVDKYCKETKIKKGDFTYDLIPMDILFPYACMDVDYTLQLADYFKQMLEEEEQVQVYKDVVGYAWALARIEMTGWKVDLESAAAYKEELTVRIAALHEELQDLPEIKKSVKVLSAIALEKENEKRKTPLVELKKPLSFLVNSVAHKRCLFRDVLRFPEVKKTKKGAYSTDKECFAVWAEKHPDVASIKTIKEIEELSKMLGTYVNAVLSRSINGRLSCSYRVCGTGTGRISASAPNLQNISQHSLEAKRLKKCFIADEGFSILACDLSNAELRVTAAISNDPVMCDSFSKGFDPHSATAKAVFNPDCEVGEIKEKHPDLRQRAKTLNFAALYGSSAMNIAKSLGISDDDAQEMLDDYFRKHVGVTRMFKDNLRYAREHGYVVYPNGRKRRVPHINSDDHKLAARAERQVNNSVIQGCSSDIALTALYNMWTEIDEKQLPYRIINIIHDSIEMEVPDSEIEAAREFILRHMSIWGNYLTAPFPMKADAEVGKTWADLKEFESAEFAVVEEDSEDDEEEAA